MATLINETSKKITLDVLKGTEIDLVDLSLDETIGWSYRYSSYFPEYTELLIDFKDSLDVSYEISDAEENFNSLIVNGSDESDDFGFYHSKWDTDENYRSDHLKLFFFGGEGDDKIFIHGIIIL